ncbi:MAG: hypothetical protein HY782_10400 [Chloroflexi bacterium]|nr:hypothetical protein [Chloroflexota bacterium]
MGTESAEPELITIIEGPTPEFHVVGDPWTFSVLEGQAAYIAAACQVRSFNGQKLLDRCRRAWTTQRAIRLDFRQMDGLRRQVEIIGARLDKIEGVDVLNLWVRQPVRALIGGINDSAPYASDD